jgi:hypothetical protein
VIEVALRSTILGFVGGFGNVAGSGVLWKIMLGFFGSSTEREADQEVSPLSELAVQVYKAVSWGDRSEIKHKSLLLYFSLPVEMVIVNVITIIHKL